MREDNDRQAGDRQAGDRQAGRPVSESERREAARLHRDWLSYILLCAVFGIALGVGLAALLIRLDVSGIGTMLAHSPHQLGYRLLLAGGLASTFGMISMGVGIMIRAMFF
jgi:hypothetical protein